LAESKHSKSKSAPITGQSLVGGAMVMAVAILVTKVIGFIYKVPHSAILDGDGVGVYQQAYSFYTIVYSIALTGFPTAISKIIVDYQKQGRYKDIRGTIRAANRFFLALGAVGSLILILLARFYAGTLLGNLNIAISVMAVAPSIVFSCMMSVHRGYYQGMRNMTPTAVSQVIESVVKCLVGLGFAYMTKAHFTDEYFARGTVFGTAFNSFQEARVSILSLSAAGALVGVTVSTFAGWVFLIIRRRIDGDGITEEQYASSPEALTSSRLLRQIVMIGVPITVAGIAPQITSFFCDIIIQSRLISALGSNPVALFASHGGWMEKAGKSIYGDPGKTATFLAGCYGFGEPFFSLAPAITSAFNISALPHVADSWIAGDREAVRRNINTTLKMTAIFSAPVGFGIAALGTPILNLVFARRNPAEVAIGGTMLSIMSAAMVFLSIYAASITMLNAIGRYDIPVKLLFAGGLINLLVTYILVGIPAINIKGAPVGNLLSYIPTAVLSIYFLYKNTLVKIDVFGVLIKPLIAGAVCALTAYAAYRIQIEFFYDLIRQRVATATAILAAAVVFLMAIGFLKIVTKEELRAMSISNKIGDILEKLRIVR